MDEEVAAKLIPVGAGVSEGMEKGGLEPRDRVLV